MLLMRGSVPTTAAALPLWTAMPILCLKKEVERGSPVRAAILPPISAQISSADGPHAPNVSIAIGAKIYLIQYYTNKNLS